MVTLVTPGAAKLNSLEFTLVSDLLPFRPLSRPLTSAQPLPPKPCELIVIVTTPAATETAVIAFGVGIV
jgi:hypothetical protein